MENEVQEEVIEQSIILDEGEVRQALSEEEPQEEVVLPSDDNFEMPDKFKGKSAEEIAKAYAELEKFKAIKEQQTEEPVKEEAPVEDGEINPILEEGRPEGSQDIPADKFTKYLNELDTNGSISEEAYAELAELGYNREFVDEKVDYIKYKREKEVNKVLEPYGGVQEFEKVSNWARGVFSEAQLANINKQLASGNKEVQDAVLSSLYNGYKQSATNAPEPEVTLHTNQPQATRTEGYSTKSEYLKDAKDPRYDRDPGYRKQVEQKMLKTNMEKWY